VGVSRKTSFSVVRWVVQIFKRLNLIIEGCLKLLGQVVIEFVSFFVKTIGEMIWQVSLSF
jgi:hypothetical protein